MNYSVYFTPYLLHGAVLEKLTSSQLVKKFPAFYRTRRFIIARHLSLFRASSMQSTSTQSHFLKIHFNIIRMHIIHCTVVMFYSYYRYALHNGVSANDGGPIRLLLLLYKIYNIIIYFNTIVLQLPTAFSAVSCCTGLYPRCVLGYTI